MFAICCLFHLCGRSLRSLDRCKGSEGTRYLKSYERGLKDDTDTVVAAEHTVVVAVAVAAAVVHAHTHTPKNTNPYRPSRQENKVMLLLVVLLLLHAPGARQADRSESAFRSSHNV